MELPSYKVGDIREAICQRPVQSSPQPNKESNMDLFEKQSLPTAAVEVDFAGLDNSDHPKGGSSCTGLLAVAATTRVMPSAADNEHPSRAAGPARGPASTPTPTPAPISGFACAPTAATAAAAAPACSSGSSIGSNDGGDAACNVSTAESAGAAPLGTGPVPLWHHPPLVHPSWHHRLPLLAAAAATTAAGVACGWNLPLSQLERGWPAAQPSPAAPPQPPSAGPCSSCSVDSPTSSSFQPLACQPADCCGAVGPGAGYPLPQGCSPPRHRSQPYPHPHLGPPAMLPPAVPPLLYPARLVRYTPYARPVRMARWGGAQMPSCIVLGPAPVASPEVCCDPWCGCGAVATGIPHPYAWHHALHEAAMAPLPERWWVTEVAAAEPLPPPPQSSPPFEQQLPPSAAAAPPPLPVAAGCRDRVRAAGPRQPQSQPQPQAQTHGRLSHLQHCGQRLYQQQQRQRQPVGGALLRTCSLGSDSWEAARREFMLGGLDFTTSMIGPAATRCDPDDRRLAIRAAAAAAGHRHLLSNSDGGAVAGAGGGGRTCGEEAGAALRAAAAPRAGSTGGALAPQPQPLLAVSASAGEVKQIPAGVAATPSARGFEAQRKTPGCGAEGAEAATPTPVMLPVSTGQQHQHQPRVAPQPPSRPSGDPGRNSSVTRATPPPPPHQQQQQQQRDSYKGTPGHVGVWQAYGAVRSAAPARSMLPYEVARLPAVWAHGPSPAAMRVWNQVVSGSGGGVDDARVQAGDLV